jgi:hypothetical protein
MKLWQYILAAVLAGTVIFVALAITFGAYRPSAEREDARAACIRENSTRLRATRDDYASMAASACDAAKAVSGHY